MDHRMSSGFGAVGSAGSIAGMEVVGKEDAVPVGFDEAVLRALCDMDVSSGTGHFELRLFDRKLLMAVRAAASGRPDKTVHRLVQGQSGLVAAGQTDDVASRSVLPVPSGYRGEVRSVAD